MGNNVVDEIWNVYNSQKFPVQKLNKNVATIQKREFNMLKINISSQGKLQTRRKKIQKMTGNIM